MFRIGGITPYASGFHSQASGPSWAGALRLRFWPQVAGWYREQLCRGAHRLRQLIIHVLSTRMPLYLKCIATYEFLLGCAINAAQRLGTISIAIAISELGECLEKPGRFNIPSRPSRYSVSMASCFPHAS